MPKALQHIVAVPLDEAIVHTECTACRMRLHKLRLLLEQAEDAPAAVHEQRVYEAGVRCYRALHRLEAHVHVCQTPLESATSV